MLTLSIISSHLSCQSILVCLSIYRSGPPADLTPCMTLYTPLRELLSFEKLDAEWMVMPLIRAAAVPGVAVISSRYEIPFLANSAATASMMREFPVPPSRTN